MPNLHITFGWLGSWVVLLLLSTLAAKGVHYPAPGAEPGAMQVTLAMCCSWLAALLAPVDAGRGKRVRAMMLWAAMAAAGFLSLSWSPLFFEQGNRSVQLAGAVLILVLLFSSMQSLIRAYAPSRASSMTLFTLLAGVFITAPLYLSVAAEAAPNQVLVVDSIIAASPVSYLSGIAEYDYLRSGWFYRHMPFGGLRFNYPDPGFMTVCYVVITLVLGVANTLGNRPETRTQSQ